MEKTYMSSSSRNLVDAASSSDNTKLNTATRQIKVIPLQHPASSSSSSSVTSSSSPFVFSLGSKWREKVKGMSWVHWLEFFLPCLRWIRIYKWKEYLQVDLLSGITVGIMLVPQAMSYAKLAGLHPIYGLYSGFVPIFVYAIFGSSRQLAIGPVALVSLLVSNVLGAITDSSDELYTQLAILLALMVGVLECIMGLLRLGWLIRFISHSVISGFTTSSAIIISLSQAKYFLGYDIVRSSEIVPLVKSIIAGADKVGDIPQGLPKFSIPKMFDHAKSLVPTALLITGVAILESVGIAKALAAKNGYELDSNQELFGLGVANICGSFFSAYPTTGSFSRSAVNNESGARTGLSGITMGIIMACALMFMTPLFREIPQCALAAIVISAVMGLVDYEEALFLWRVDKKDFFLWTTTSITTLFLSIEIGVLVGVGFSLAFVIHESANPHIAVLGRLPGTTIYRNIEQYPEAYTYNGIVIVRIDAPIYFANISYIKDRLREYEVNTDGAKRGPEVEKVYFVIIEMAPVTYIDSSAAQALRDLHQEYKSRDIQIAIANPNQEVLLTLSKSGLYEMVGKEWYFVRVHDAVQVCLQHVPTSVQRPKPVNRTPENKSSFLQRLQKHREDWSNLESGAQDHWISPDTEDTVDKTAERQSSLFDRLLKQVGDDTSPQSEPLLPRKA